MRTVSKRHVIIIFYRPFNLIDCLVTAEHIILSNKNDIGDGQFFKFPSFGQSFNVHCTGMVSCPFRSCTVVSSLHFQVIPSSVRICSVHIKADSLCTCKAFQVILGFLPDESQVFDACNNSQHKLCQIPAVPEQFTHEVIIQRTIIFQLNQTFLKLLFRCQFLFLFHLRFPALAYLCFYFITQKRICQGKNFDKGFREISLTSKQRK